MAKDITPAQKSANFKKKASKRMNSLLAGIDKLGKLAGSRVCQHTPAEVKKMQDALGKALGTCFARFEGKITGGEGFDF